MIGLVKFLHFLGLMLGAGGGFGAMVIAGALRRTPGAAPQLGALRPIFGRLSLAGIVLIWLTGLWLYFGLYAAAPIGTAFSAKLVAAAALLAVVLTLTVVQARARKRGTPPPAWVPRLGMAAPVLTLLAVALAVVAFS